MSTGLYVDNNARRVDFAELQSMRAPDATRSYRPLHFADQVTMVDRAVADLIDEPVTDRTLALTHDGARFLGAWTVEREGQANLSLLAGGSWDKSTAAWIARGASIKACTNGMVWGADFRSVRKNTTNVYPDARALIWDMVEGAQVAFEQSMQFADEISEIPCHDVRGAEIIGWAQYLGVLRPQQATVAFREWKNPSHEEFAPRTLWSLYNAFTEAVKRGPAASLVGRLANGGNSVDAFMRDVQAKEQARADFIQTARDCIREVYSARNLAAPSAALPAPVAVAELIDN